MLQEHLQSPFNSPGKSPLSKKTLSDSAAAAEEKTKQEIWAMLSNHGHEQYNHRAFVTALYMGCTGNAATADATVKSSSEREGHPMQNIFP